MNNDSLPSDSYVRPLPDGEVAVIPLLKETLEVVRMVEETGAVRVRVLVEETVARALSESALDEVETTRVPRGVEVRERREPWSEGGALVVPIYEEVIVTERRLMLKEEVHITRLTRHTSEPVEMPVRRERVVVERRRADGAWVLEEV